jgi:2-phospho-L-lactate guanylyltransferase
MLHDVLKSIASSDEIESTIVVTPEQEAVNLAKSFGFSTILEKEQRGVNFAVNIANEYCLNNGASSTIIIPADIPLIKPEDIKKIVNSSRNDQSVVIIPSKRMDGTNALLRSPPDVIKTSYDSSSYTVHKKYASEQKIPISILKLYSVMLDLDLQEDLKEFMDKESETQTYKFLSKIKPFNQ